MDVYTSMNQYQLPSQEKKPEYVRSNFNEIAKAYDRFNDWNSFFLHRSWKNWLVKTALEEVPNASIAIDLCCGTGDITKRLSDQKNLQKIYGIDFSDQMLSFAFLKIPDESRVSLEVGDAMNLSKIKDNSADIVTMGFGLRNVENLELCLREVQRILKPGGAFLNLDVGRVRPKFLKYFADFYFFRIVPLFGYLLLGKGHEMFDYLPHSSKAYPDQETLLKILEEQGFVGVWFKNFVFGNAVAHIAKKS